MGHCGGSRVGVMGWRRWLWLAYWSTIDGGGGGRVIGERLRGNVGRWVGKDGWEAVAVPDSWRAGRGCWK